MRLNYVAAIKSHSSVCASQYNTFDTYLVYIRVWSVLCLRISLKHQ